MSDNSMKDIKTTEVNEQNNKVEFSRKKQELIKIIDKFIK